MKANTSLTVGMGDSLQTFQVGNFLNAIDEVSSAFISTREITEVEVADALDLYAKRLRKDGER